MTRCGSRDPEHRVKDCKRCIHLYNRAYKRGERFDRVAFGMPRATCKVCGLAQANGLKVKVRRYPLLRSITKRGRRTSVVIGSIGLCDRCILREGELKPGVAA
jgi:hypothetical protein